MAGIVGAANCYLSQNVVLVVQSIELLPFLNVALRASTLLAKFLLVFILARFMTPADVGVFGLLSATVIYALYAVGLDFHNYTMRELLQHERGKIGGFLKSHGALCGVLYLAFLPLGFCIFMGGLLPWQLAPWFFCLLVLEHLNQEMARLMIATGRPMWASVLLFFRSGLWPVVVAVVMFLDADYRSLTFVFQSWALGAMIGLLAGGVRLSTSGIGGWKDKVDWQWIGRGLKIALPLICATLALKGLSTFDRYWFQGLVNADALGAYVLFGGICSSLLSFLDAGVFAFTYPALIKAYQSGDHAAYVATLKKLGVHTLLFTLVFACCASIAIYPLLLWLDKPIYLAHMSLFFWLLTASALSALAMVPHYALYAQGWDRPIVLSHVLGLLVFFVVTGLLVGPATAYAVPAGLCIAFAFILSWKAVSFYRLTPAPFRSPRPADHQAVI